MDFNEWFEALLSGTLPELPAPPVTFETLYQHPDAETLFDVKPEWIDTRALPAPTDPATRRYVLRAIQDADPDGHDWRTTAPTEADYASHEAWAVKTFGHEAWCLYSLGGWDDRTAWLAEF